MIVLTPSAVEISSMMIVESSKSKNDVIEFMYAPFFSESLQIYDKEEAKRRQTTPPLLNCPRRPHKTWICPKKTAAIPEGIAAFVYI